MSRLKLLSLFSGIGAFEKALDNLGIDYELVNYCEIDKYASKAYSAIHNVSEKKNLGDITKVDENALPKDIDLITYGFPCQDISISGRQKGLFNSDGSQTRSGLFFEALRIIHATQPEVAIAENVKNLVSNKFAEQFHIVLNALEEAGYNNYWAVLNAKDFGIPQNRERVFIVSIRKDVDNGNFKFPKAFPLELRLKDMLDDVVDEKYYLKKTLNIRATENYLQWDNSGKGYSSQQARAYYQDGIAPTLSCCNSNGDKSQVVLKDKNDLIEPICLNSKGGRGGVEGLQPSIQDRVYDSEGISTAVTTSFMPSFTDGMVVRKLTPRECYRLQGFDDESFERAQSVCSNSQLYKQAGNSICVPVIQNVIGALINSYK